MVGLCITLFDVCVYSPEDGEKKDQDKVKEEAPPEPLPEEKKAPKKRPGLKKESPEEFMASFFSSLDIYQTKMLVKPHTDAIPIHVI